MMSGVEAEQNKTILNTIYNHSKISLFILTVPTGIPFNMVL